MARGEGVEVHLGGEWFGALRSALRVPGGLDDFFGLVPERLMASVDLVVDRVNHTGPLRPERVLPFLERLCGGIERLASGQSCKAIVEFEESPWELALVRRAAPVVHLSLYEVVPPGRVRIEEVPVSLRTLADALDRAIGEMLERVAPLPDHPELERFRRLLQACRARLPQGEVRPPRPRPSGPAAPERLPIQTRFSAGLELVTELEPRGHALLHYDGEHSLDRHALLVSGTFAMMPEGLRPLLCRGRPLAMLEQILDAVALTVEEWPRADGDRSLLLLPDQEVFLRFGPQGAILSRDGNTWQDWRPAFEADELLLALCDHTADVVRACFDLNPLLQANDHLVELGERAAQLRAAVVDRIGLPRETATTRRHRDRARVRRTLAAAAQEPPAPTPRATPPVSAFPFSLEDARLLRYHEPWHVERAQIEPASLRLIGPLLRFRSERGVEALCLETGERRWRLQREGETFGAHACGLELEGREGQLSAWDELRGTLRWRVAHDARGLLMQADAHAELLVCAFSDGTLLGLSPATGAVRWRHACGPGLVPTLHVDGQRVMAGTRDGALIVLDAATGAPRFTDEFAGPLRHLGACGDFLVGIAPQHRRGILQTRVYRGDGTLVTQARERASLWGWSRTPERILWCSEGDDARALSLLCAGGLRQLPLPRDFIGGGVSVATAGEDVALLMDRHLFLLRPGREGQPVTRWQVEVPEAALHSLMDRVPLRICGDLVALGSEPILLLGASTGRLVHALPSYADKPLTWLLDPRGGIVLLDASPCGASRIRRIALQGVLAPMQGGAAA